MYETFIRPYLAIIIAGLIAIVVVGLLTANPEGYFTSTSHTPVQEDIKPAAAPQRK